MHAEKNPPVNRLQTIPHIRQRTTDNDSTLITSEVIDELAIEAGVGEQVAAKGGCGIS